MNVFKSRRLLIALLTIVFIFMVSAFGLSFIMRANADEGEDIPGTSPGNPILVYSEADLLGTDGKWGGSSFHYKLVTDLELSADFMQLAMQSESFTGSFDGNGYTISGLTQKNGSTFGLFSEIGEGGLVKNLGLVDCDISLDSDSEVVYIGALAGVNYGTIENCYVTGNINVNKVAGGLVGRNYGTIENCHNESTVNGTISGGIAGINGGDHHAGLGFGTIINCYNTGNISGSDNVGGITGENNWEITDCYNTGNISGSKCIGGIVGILTSNGSKISNCFNSGNIKGDTIIGGIAGSSNSEITNCYNTGGIECSENAGGIAGVNEGNGVIRNCYSAAKFSATNDTIGGIVGVNNDGGLAEKYYFDSEVAGSGICDVGGRMVTNTSYLTTSLMTYDRTLERGHSMEYLQNDNAWVKRANEGINLYYPELAVFYNTAASKESAGVSTKEQTVGEVYFKQAQAYEYTYGDKLESLNGVLANEQAFTYINVVIGNEIAGTFAFENGEYVPNAGMHTVNIVFTPNGGEAVRGFTLIISVEKKQAVAPTPLPSGFEAKVGDSLSGISLAEYVDFKWEDPSYVFDKAGEIEVWAIYNSDPANYIDVRVKLTVDIVLKDGEISVEITDWTYNETANAPEIDILNEADYDVDEAIIEYKVRGANDNTYTITVPTKAGDYTVRVSFEATENYKAATTTADFTVAKAQAVAPGTLPSFTAKVGQTLADITLPAGYSWKNSGTSVGGVGTRTFDAEYNLDPLNYNSVDVQLSVTVSDEPSSSGLNPTQISLMVGAIALVVLGAVLMIVFIARRRRQKQG